MDEKTEAAMIDLGLRALHDVAGVRPEGYRAPMWEMNYHTPQQRADPGAPAGQPGRHRRGGGVPGRTGVQRDRRADPAAQWGRDPDPRLNLTDGRFACLGT
jgi:hypothetical protein